MAAIYMWFQEYFQLLTTTLYPIEIIDSLELNISVAQGTMELIPYDSMESTQSLESATYIQKRWFYSDGPYDDSMESTQSLESATYTQLRWFYTDGPYDDSIESTQDLVSASYNNKRVPADTPDQELQLSITIDSNGTMELI